MDNSRINACLGHNAVDGGCAEHDADAIFAWSRDGESGEFGVAAHRGFGAAPHHCGETAAEPNGSARAGFIAETGAGDQLHRARGSSNGSYGDYDGDSEWETGADCGWRGSFECQTEFSSHC